LYALGTHLLVELKDCDREILKNLHEVREAMLAAAKAAKATVVEEAFHEFSPFGVSGMVVIAESHLSIHTWPEYGYAAVDIFTCGDVLAPEVAADYLVKRFRCRQPSMVVVKRGILAGGKQRLPHKVREDRAPDVGASQLQMVS